MHICCMVQQALKHASDSLGLCREVVQSFYVPSPAQAATILVWMLVEHCSSQGSASQQFSQIPA